MEKRAAPMNEAASQATTRIEIPPWDPGDWEREAPPPAPPTARTRPSSPRRRVTTTRPVVRLGSSLTTETTVKRIAVSLLGIGLLLLSFVAYQLWGTALYEHSAQARLQAQLKGSLHTVGKLPSIRRNSTGAPPLTLVSRTAPPSADPPIGNAVGLISIPAIGLADVALVEGTGEDQLEEGPGHYPGTPLPGEAGNSAVAGHRTTYGAPFYNLDALGPGDAIDVQTSQGIFQYRVVATRVVSPSDTSVLQQTVLPELTLTTCNPRYSSTQRLVVQALLTTAITNGSFQPTARPPTTADTPKTLAGADTNSAHSGGGVAGTVLAAVLWGLAAVAAAIGGVVLSRRLGGWMRWTSALAFVVALFFLLSCFQNVSLALPASF